MTPSPNEIVGEKPERQKATKSGNELVAICRLLSLVIRRKLSPFAAGSTALNAINARQAAARTFDRRTGELSGSLSGSARFTSKRTAETKSL
jgi:hypothetical protein